MHAIAMDTRGFSELDGAELSEIGGGMPLIVAAFWIAMAIGGIAAAGIIVGAAVYVFTRS